MFIQANLIYKPLVIGKFMANDANKYLVMCWDGQHRSPVGAGALTRMLKKFGRTADHVTWGAYSSFSAAPDRRVRFVAGFTEIFVTDEYMREGLIRAGISPEKVFCFNIRDGDYSPGQYPEIENDYRAKFAEHFKNQEGAQPT